MNKERNHTIDILRGIAIFLVVFGHVTHLPEVRTYIWGFHIPIFFFISGLLFRKEKFAKFTDFLKSRFKNIVLPYAIFYLATLVYWILIERHSRGADVSIGSQLIGLVYGTYDMRYMMFNGALWFIPCLFSMEMLYWFVSKCSKRIYLIGVLICFYIIGLVLKDNAPWLPWGLCAAFIGIVFYGIGDMCKPIVLTNKIRFGGGKLPLKYLIFTLILAIQLAALPWTGADLASLKVGNVWLYIPISMLGVTLYWGIASTISHNKIIEYLGVNSLVIFAFQEPVYRAVIFIVSKIIGWFVQEVRCDLMLCLFISVCSILVVVPMIVCWNKWARPLIKRI